MFFFVKLQNWKQKKDEISIAMKLLRNILKIIRVKFANNLDVQIYNTEFRFIR